MNILVIGCDQVGASLVRDLEHIGHDISLIEKDPEQLKRLDGPDEGSDGQPRLAEPSQSKPNGFASSPEGGAFYHLPVRTDKAPPFGGAVIEQSEMTERVSPPRSWHGAFSSVSSCKN